MSVTTWHPYAPDQAFGARSAADEEVLDRLVAALDAGREAPPRASNKAPVEGERTESDDEPGGERRAPALYRLAKRVLQRPLRLLYRVEVDGLDHLPDGGPAIVAANHLAFIDSIFLAFTSPRPLTFVAKAEYFDRRTTRWLFRHTGQIPLRRGSPRSAQEALAAAADVLKAGGLVAVYPEGTRSRDGRLRRGSLAPARLSVMSGAPIVPVGLVGTEQVQPIGSRLPRPFRSVAVRFGPHRPPVGNGDGASRPELRRATDELMADIAGLSGQRRMAAG